jgi:hypothetical protein
MCKRRRRGIASLAATPEPYLALSRYTALQETVLCHRHLPTSVYPNHYSWTFASWGILPSMCIGRLPTPSVGERRGFHRSVYSLCATLDRCFTPGSVASSAWLPLANQAEEVFPFTAFPSSLRTVDDQSLAVGAVPQRRGATWAAPRQGPTPLRGWRSHPDTWGGQG